MGLHRLTPVMTSAQRHNKANSRLLQVQLLGLPGGEQKTPKKHCHVVGGGQQGATRAAPGWQTCKSAAAQPHPCCSVPWGRGQRGLWGGTSTEGWGRRGATPCASAPSSVSIQHKTQAKRTARSAEALSASASRPVLSTKPPGSSCFTPKYFGARAWHPSGRKQRRSEGTRCPLTEVILQ